MATLLGAPMPPSLEPHWRVVLRNEFHDILPGSSIREVYQEAEAELAAVVAAGLKVQDGQLEAIAGRAAGSGAERGVLVVNPDLSPRPLRLSLPQSLPNGQKVEEGSVSPVTFPCPASPHRSFSTPGSPRRIRRASAAWRMRSCVSRSARTEPSRASSTSARAARSSRIAPTRSGRIATSRATGTPGTSRTTIRRSGEEIAASGIEVVENGPHRAAMRVTRRFRDSTIVQSLRLWANSARLEFKTDIDWHDAPHPAEGTISARHPLRPCHLRMRRRHRPPPDASQHLVGGGAI